MGEFWGIVWSAEWAATVGLPLLVTVGSLGVAYVFVRRQLQHDRDLAAAQRRADAAGRLGAALIDIQRRFEDKPPADPRWTEPKWPEWSEVYHAVEEAEVVLDEEAAFEYAQDVARCISWGWQACQRRRAEMEQSGDASTPIDFANALSDTLLPHTHRLYEIGKHLIRWDGHGSVTVDELESFQRVPLKRGLKSEEYLAWCGTVADEFAERAERFRSLRVTVRRRRRR